MSRGLIPIPWSRTLTCTVSPSTSTVTRTSPPPGEYLIALPTRLVKICSTLSGSPQTTGRLAGSLVRRVCLAAIARNGERIRSTTATRSRGRVEHQAARLHPGHAQQVVDEAGQAAGGVEDLHRRGPLALGRHVPQDQQLGEPVDQGQRG